MTSLSAMRLVAALGLAAAGCGSSPDYQTLCQAREQCIGGNDADVSACVDTAELGEEQADTRSCGDEYRAAIECVSGHVACADQSAGYCNQDADCAPRGGGRCVDYQCMQKRFSYDEDACRTELGAYSACYGKELGQ